MNENIYWGILGAGTVSRLFATGLQDAEGAKLVAVASRSLERASGFASEFDVPRVYGSYEELAEDEALDAVYIGTPHSFHKEHVSLCLRAGRNVLCEKPFAINAAQAEAMINVARGEKRTLMEAMWTRFIPSMAKVREFVEEGGIGEIRGIEADFGFRADFDPKNRLFDPALGGGALLDVGVYGVSLAHMLLGEPETVAGSARMGETGVDEESTAILGYEGGAKATLTMAVRRETSCEASIIGTSGSIRITAPWWQSDRIIVARESGDEDKLDIPFKGNGYTHEAEEFMELIRTGKLESDVMPLAESLSVMKSMDRIRRKWGLKYPME